VLILATRDEVTRVRKSRNSTSLIIRLRIAARVVEMQVRVDDDANLFRPDARDASQRFSERTFALDAVKTRLLRRPFLTDACFNIAPPSSLKIVSGTISIR
jgi:hypothetical protein